MILLQRFLFSVVVGVALSAVGCAGVEGDPDDDLTGDWSSTAPEADPGEEVVSQDQASSAAKQPTQEMRTLRDVIKKEYSVKTIGCVRADSYPDHPSGKACDFMVSSGGKAATGANFTRGKDIANFAKTNAKEYGVKYVMWDRKIWSYARRSEGWRSVADRGSSTANHEDHVHITVN